MAREDQEIEIGGVRAETSLEHAERHHRIGGVGRGPPEEVDPRKEAARELRRGGIGYVLSFDKEADTLDLRRNAELYGAREIAHNRDAKLYELP